MIYLDVLALVLSSIAIGITVYNQHRSFQKQNSSMMKDYFDVSFKMLLFKVLPKLINNKRFIDGKLEDKWVDRVLETLRKLLGKALFYKYCDNKFYNRLLIILDDLETFIVEISNKVYNEPNDQRKTNSEIDSEFQKLYTMMYKHYYSDI